MSERAVGSGLLLGISAAVAISLTNVFSRAHFDAGSTPTTFLVGRYILFVLALTLVLGLRGRLRRLNRLQWRELALAGSLNVIGASCLAFAIERLAVGLAVVVLYLFPLLTLLMGAALDRRRPRAMTLLGLTGAFVGLALALDIGGDPPDPVGIGFAVAAAVGIAASFVCIERRLDDVGDAMRIYGISVVGLVAALALGASGGDIVWPLPAPHGWWTLLAATITFAAASSWMFMAVSRIGATSTSVLMNLEPPATVLFAALILGDRLQTLQLIGIGIVVVCVSITQWLTGRDTAA